ncbi:MULTISPECIES: hypothetical protein [unclassified Sporosarcina]|uniref:hypothetical protein n=1 Tax=unclassified Sporosarcina TaxID=2647733 RepID=UPI001A932543|nr:MULTISPECIES: hypothetical protein [unclassified Sporosarcina]MBO0588166.1 hypothetical protein [Sporosarcina sp. E16_8]MBO0601920.1 hypothetical protein [Sporosarcina sp. E16_3]
MKVNENKIVSIYDENDRDTVGEFLDEILEHSLISSEAEMHLLYIQKAFEILRFHPLESILHKKIDVLITFQGYPRLKSYVVVKVLTVYPIYELRYAMNGNIHLRFLFFPMKHNGQSYYVFAKQFIKTRRPNMDQTNQMRDLAYQMYEDVLRNPGQYLEGTD